MPRCFLESDFISGWVQLAFGVNSYPRLTFGPNGGSELEQSSIRIKRNSSHCVYSSYYWSSTEEAVVVAELEVSEAKVELLAGSHMAKQIRLRVTTTDIMSATHRA